MKHVGGIMRPAPSGPCRRGELGAAGWLRAGYRKSRAQARELLKQAGVDNLTVKLFNRTVSEPYTPAGIFVINEWRKIGVAAEHLQVETRTYFDSLVAGSFEVAIWPLTEPADDPSAQLYGFITNKASTLSYSRHNDAKLDDLFERQQRTLDPAQRLRLVQEADRYALAQAYSVPILWWNRIVVHDKKIKGWTMSLQPLPGHGPDQRVARPLKCPASPAIAPSSARRWAPSRGFALKRLSRAPLKPNSVRIAVKAAGLNFPDILMIRGAYQHRPALPFVPGLEAAGIVTEVARRGWQARRWRPGHGCARQRRRYAEAGRCRRR